MAYIGKNPKQNTSTLVPQSADPSNPTEGQLFYSDGTSRAEGVWVYKNGAFEEVGAGAGSLDIFHQDDLDIAVTGDFSTGNNATFLGGGSVAGTLAIESAAQISGRQSLKFTQAAGSLNDYVSSGAFSIDPKQANSDCKVSLYFTYDGDAADIEFVVYDQTGTAVITDSLDSFTSESNATRYETTFFVPSTSTELKWGFQVAVANSGKILVVDDVEFSTNPFVSKNLMSLSAVRVTSGSTYGSTNTDIRIFTDVEYNLGSDIVYATSATLGDSFTVQRTGLYAVSYSDSFNIGDNMGISKNAASLNTAIHVASPEERLGISGTSASGNPETVGGQFYFQAGDIIRAHTNAQNQTPGSYASFTITSLIETEHIVTPAKSNMTDWTAYTPTTQGFGTLGTNEFEYKQVGDSYHIQGNFTTGTLTASEAQVSLPNSKTVKTSQLITLVGNGTTNAADAKHIEVLSTGGDAFLNFGRRDSGTAGMVADLGNSVVAGNGDIISFYAIVKIEGLSSDATFLAAVPVQKVAYIKDEKSSGTVGGAGATATWTKRDLNTIQGDSEIVSISSSVITLSAGKYDISGLCPCYRTQKTRVRLQNTSDSTTAILGGSVWSSPAVAGDDTIQVPFGGVITITESKTFEVQMYTQVTNTTSDFGFTTDIAGVNEVYSQIKITKLK